MSDELEQPTEQPTPGTEVTNLNQGGIKPVKKEEFKNFEEEEEVSEEGEVVRVPLPRQGEMLGVIDKLLGAARMYVRCVDGKTRLGRVPGSMMRKLYIEQGDLVIIKPWEYEEDTKCDILYKYRKVQVSWLRRKGYLAKLEEEF